MPSVSVVSNLNVLAGGGSYNLATSASYNLYKVQGSSGPVTLTANLSINSSGTLANGLLYKFEWIGDITPNGNTVTIMGAIMPDELVNKQCLIEAHYVASAWKVFFYPTTNQSSIFDPLVFTYHPYNLSTFDNNSPTTSTASGAEETLAISTPVVAADVPIRALKVFASGTTGAGANAKTISLKTLTGATPAQTIITNTITTAPTSKDWYIEALIIFGNGDETYSCANITFNGIAPEIKINTNTAAYDIANSAVQLGITALSTGGAPHTVTCHTLIVETVTEIV